MNQLELDASLSNLLISKQWISQEKLNSIKRTNKKNVMQCLNIIKFFGYKERNFNDFLSILKESGQINSQHDALADKLKLQIQSHHYHLTSSSQTKYTSIEEHPIEGSMSSIDSSSNEYDSFDSASDFSEDDINTSDTDSMKSCLNSNYPTYYDNKDFSSNNNNNKNNNDNDNDNQNDNYRRMNLSCDLFSEFEIKFNDDKFLDLNEQKNESRQVENVDAKTNNLIDFLWLIYSSSMFIILSSYSLVAFPINSLKTFFL